MSDQSGEQRRAEIAARLNAATPGEWQHVHYEHDSEHRRMVVGGVHQDEVAICCHPVLDAAADADLIANAPADLAWLLTELARAEAALAEREAAYVELNNTATTLVRLLYVANHAWDTEDYATLDAAVAALDAVPSALAAQVRARHRAEWEAEEMRLTAACAKLDAWTRESKTGLVSIDNGVAWQGTIDLAPAKREMRDTLADLLRALADDAGKGGGR